MPAMATDAASLLLQNFRKIFSVVMKYAAATRSEELLLKYRFKKKKKSNYLFVYLFSSVYCNSLPALRPVGV